MKILLIVTVLVLLAAASARDLRQEHECPAYECDATTNTGCLLGYTCLPINCGDVCVEVQEKQTACSLIMCDLYCQNGFVHDENGCAICKCKLVDLVQASS